jgi:hypothetical protein
MRHLFPIKGTFGILILPKVPFPFHLARTVFVSLAITLSEVFTLSSTSRDVNLGTHG